jgi:hypothetical protein
MINPELDIVSLLLIVKSVCLDMRKMVTEGNTRLM